ncbi:putative pilin/flagellin [Halanaeroarchaeum sp. HSR-CO]|uniref:DUF7287 family protein n=1 Tax=Halanaeroarchaeum sp. HSR-CO TaxID=2866382 RepID=UPI00217D57F9|nr:hypothetical protein [Halanaeroarchaeum sp. HSR-CO]UWG47718.1 putative pilin/flagellin [Halanaeroarchaeum sp. HSR-CO]
MRAQTTLDFLIGTTIFLLTVSMVIGMVPGILDPFALDRSSAPVETNRAATILATDELVVDGSPYALDTSTVETFFNESDDTVRSRLALGSDVSYNITLETENETIGTTGDPVPNGRSITSAWRVVSYDGEQAKLRVRTW